MLKGLILSELVTNQDSLIVVMDLLNSLRNRNDLKVLQMDHISDAVWLVCCCTWAERTVITR